MSTASPVSPSLNSASDEALLTNLLNYYGTYHNHKETVAFSIFGLEGAFFIGLFSFANWPDTITRMDKTLLSAIFVLVWVLFHGALRFQLRYRRLAAIIVAALMDSLLGGVEQTFKKSDYAVASTDQKLIRIDEWLFPVRRAIRPSDVDLPALPDGARVLPKTIDAYRMHLARRKSDAQTNRTAYALPIEYVSTAGSMLMLAIALIRVITLAPLPEATGQCNCTATAPTPAASAAVAAPANSASKSR